MAKASAFTQPPPRRTVDPGSRVTPAPASASSGLGSSLALGGRSDLLSSFGAGAGTLKNSRSAERLNAASIGYGTGGGGGGANGQAMERAKALGLKRAPRPASPPPQARQTPVIASTSSARSAGPPMRKATAPAAPGDRAPVGATGRALVPPPKRGKTVGPPANPYKSLTMRAAANKPKTTAPISPPRKQVPDATPAVAPPVASPPAKEESATARPAPPAKTASSSSATLLGSLWGKASALVGVAGAEEPVSAAVANGEGALVRSGSQLRRKKLGVPEQATNIVPFKIGSTGAPLDSLSPKAEPKEDEKDEKKLDPATAAAVSALVRKPTTIALPTVKPILWYKPAPVHPRNLFTSQAFKRTVSASQRTPFDWLPTQAYSALDEFLFHRQPGRAATRKGKPKGPPRRAAPQGFPPPQQQVVDPQVVAARQHAQQMAEYERQHAIYLQQLAEYNARMAAAAVPPAPMPTPAPLPVRSHTLAGPPSHPVNTLAPSQSAVRANTVSGPPSAAGMIPRAVPPIAPPSFALRPTLGPVAAPAVPPPPARLASLVVPAHVTPQVLITSATPPATVSAPVPVAAPPPPAPLSTAGAPIRPPLPPSVARAPATAEPPSAPPPVLEQPSVHPEVTAHTFGSGLPPMPMARPIPPAAPPLAQSSAQEAAARAIELLSRNRKGKASAVAGGVGGSMDSDSSTSSVIVSTKPVVAGTAGALTAESVAGPSGSSPSQPATPAVEKSEEEEEDEPAPPTYIPPSNANLLANVTDSKTLFALASQRLVRTEPAHPGEASEGTHAEEGEGAEQAEDQSDMELDYLPVPLPGTGVISSAVMDGEGLQHDTRADHFSLDGSTEQCSSFQDEEVIGQAAGEASNELLVEPACPSHALHRSASSPAPTSDSVTPVYPTRANTIATPPHVPSTPSLSLSPIYPSRHSPTLVQPSPSCDHTRDPYPSLRSRTPSGNLGQIPAQAGPAALAVPSAYRSLASRPDLIAQGFVDARPPDEVQVEEQEPLGGVEAFAGGEELELPQPLSSLSPPAAEGEEEEELIEEDGRGGLSSDAPSLELSWELPSLSLSFGDSFSLLSTDLDLLPAAAGALSRSSTVQSLKGSRMASQVASVLERSASILSQRNDGAAFFRSQVGHAEAAIAVPEQGEEELPFPVEQQVEEEEEAEEMYGEEAEEEGEDQEDEEDELTRNYDEAFEDAQGFVEAFEPAPGPAPPPPTQAKEVSRKNTTKEETGEMSLDYEALVRSTLVRAESVAKPSPALAALVVQPTYPAASPPASGAALVGAPPAAHVRLPSSPTALAIASTVAPALTRTLSNPTSSVHLAAPSTRAQPQLTSTAPSTASHARSASLPQRPFPTLRLPPAHRGSDDEESATLPSPTCAELDDEQEAVPRVSVLDRTRAVKHEHASLIFGGVVIPETKDIYRADQDELPQKEEPPVESTTAREARRLPVPPSATLALPSLDLPVIDTPEHSPEREETRQKKEEAKPTMDFFGPTVDQKKRASIALAKLSNKAFDHPTQPDELERLGVSDLFSSW